MPSVKQETMDHTTNEHKVQLKEFQVHNTSVPPPTYSHGKLYCHNLVHCFKLRYK